MPSEPLESGCAARMARPDSVSVLGLAVTGGAEGLHQRAAIGLLVVADAHHVDLAIEAEKGAGHGERRTPLAGSGLGGEVLGAVHLVVIGLRQGGVQLVRAGRAAALVFVIDVGGRIQRLLQTAGAEERRGTPLRVQLPHFAGNFDFPFVADLLQDQAHGKERGEIVGAERLEGSGMQRRSHRRGQIGGEVVPGKRNAVLRKNILDGFHAENSNSKEYRVGKVSLTPAGVGRGAALFSSCHSAGRQRCHWEERAQVRHS